MCIRDRFVVPGSLQELVSKIDEQVATSGSGTVFNWFLLQEADSLRMLALEAHDRTRETVSYTHLDVYKRQRLFSARGAATVGAGAGAAVLCCRVLGTAKKAGMRTSHRGAGRHTP